MCLCFYNTYLVFSLSTKLTLNGHLLMSIKATRCCTRLTHKFGSRKETGAAKERAASHSQKIYFPIIWLQICHLSISTLSDIIQFEHLRAGLIQLNQLNQWSSSHKFKSDQLCSKGRKKRVRKGGKASQREGKRSATDIATMIDP